MKNSHEKFTQALLFSQESQSAQSYSAAYFLSLSAFSRALAKPPSQRRCRTVLALPYQAAYNRSKRRTAARGVVSGWEDEETRDTFDRFIDNGQLPVR